MFSRHRLLLDFSRGRLAKGVRRGKQQKRTELSGGYHTRLGLEQLEDRRLLAVISWTNRGDTTGGLNNEGDGFEAAFGTGTAANQARALVDAALFNWSEVITDFNHDAAIGAPPDVELAIQIDSQDNACSAFANGTFDAASGRPVSGSLEINFCDSGPDGTSDWWIDPTPFDHSEFMGPIINAFAGKATPGGPADGMRDLLSLIQHEIGHVLGVGRDAASRLQTGGFLTDTGTFDNGQNDSPNDGTLWVFQGPSINALMTEFDIGSIGTTPGHMARPQGGTDNDGISSGGVTVYGSTDTMIGTGITFDQRILLSNKTLLVLQDAYGYDIALPEQFGTFYAAVDESTGLLTVRGGADDTLIDGVNQGASSDTISITRDGNTIAVSVDVGVDVPGTGTGMNFQDQQDAFVTYFDVGEVSSVVVNAGDGDDLVTIDPLLGVPITVNGEEGNDTIIGGDIIINGGAGNDLIRGSSGNDTLNGNEGDDTIYGLDGNDVIDGGADNDVIYAGSGINTVASIAGDGDDTIDLSENATGVTFMANGADRLLGTPFNDTFIVDNAAGLFTTRSLSFDGSGGADRLQLQGGNHTSETLAIGATPGGGRSTITGGAGTQTIDFENIEPITTVGAAVSFNIEGVAGLASLLQDDNQITYLPGQILATGGRVEVDDFEPIEFENKTNVNLRAGSGDDTIVTDTDLLPTGLTNLNIFGDEGNDTIRFEDLPVFPGTVSGIGGSGDDLLDASDITVTVPLSLSGFEGNDTLIGGAGDDELFGNDGNDTFIDSPGDDEYFGDDGTDTLIVRGTLAGDLMGVFQEAPTGGAGDDYLLTVIGPTAGTKSINADLAAAPNNPANVPDVERIVVEGLAGDDIIRVGHADEYADLNGANGVSSQTIPFEVRGDSPNASDRLVVPDDGDGDLIIQRQGADQRSGSITVGALAPIDYSEIEFVDVTPLDPITAGTGDDGAGRLVVFKNDPFESNNTLPNATFLGAGPTVNVDPTIDPGGIPLFNVPGDNDFYQFVAQETGTLDFQLYFEPITTLANGRAGLPVDGELFATVLDSDGIGVLPLPTATDLLDPVGNKIGERITVPVVRNNTYYLRVEGELGDDVTGINVYNFTAITTAAPIPELVDLQAASDSGRHNGDDITKITTPTFNIILDDDRIDEFMNINLDPDTVDDDLPTANFDYGVEVFNNAVSIGFAFYTGVGNTWEFTATAGDLNEGDFNHISAAVWIRDAASPAQIGRHLLSPSLQVTLDTVTPPVSFGLPNAAVPDDGLAADSDSGVTTVPATFADRVTSDTTPRLWGRAEADTIVSVYLDRDADGVIDLLTDTFLGQTVATPIDGNNAFPDGYWELVSALDLNQIVGLPKDGLRRLLVSAEDVAGNPMPMADQIADGVDELQIFIDTQGPQVTDVRVVDNLDYDLFDPKPSQDGPSPLVNALRIDFRDLPNRLDQAGADNDFLYEALIEGIAEAPGNYLLIGDHVGTIAIDTVVLTLEAAVDGQPATAFVELTFVNPLPDDRFTLVILDNLVDPAGNNLDGESNASEPLDDPTFPSGDGVPGGHFAARFTIDSRPEIGTFVAQNIDLDINGNFVWDPANGQIGNDATNVDLSHTLPVANPDGSVGLGGYNVHDLVFAGKFAPLQQLIVGDDAVFVIDVSGSTSGGFGGNPVGDQNSDGSDNTILDAEIAAFKLLTQELIDRGVGNTALVSIISFSSSASSLDMDPIAAGVQLTTTPLADTNGNGMRDIDEVLMSLTSGGGTDFEIPLQEAISTINAGGFTPGNGNVIFLSDGFGSGNFADEVSEIRDNLQMNLRAFGVGPGASLAQLLTIDPAAETFSNTNELLGAFGGGGGGGAGGNPSGFDQLAAYGNSAELGAFRWIIDTNNDAVVNPGEGDILTIQPLLVGINVAGAIPVAGNFDGNLANGDEIGLYFAGTWAFDFDRDFVIEEAEVVGDNGLFGHPIVGDFDGDGIDDVGVFNNNVFTFDFGFNGFNGAEDNLVWGFPGVLDRPVAADMDQDGIDDVGLWVPRNSAQSNRPLSEWYFLISNDFAAANRVTGSIVTLNHAFETVPFGNDLYAEFGDELALPIVGNFDPPVAATDPSIDPTNQAVDTGDFDQDGDTDGADFLAWQRGYGMSDIAGLRNGDGNSDGAVDHYDIEFWSNAYQTGVIATSDFNGDGWVDGVDLNAWEANFGAATAPGASGDADGDGNVDGSDFLKWQRSYRPSTAALAASLSADTASPPPALATTPASSTAESATPAAFVVIALNSAYEENLVPSAKEAAFEALEESFEADYVESDAQLSAVARAMTPEASALEDASASSEFSQREGDAWEDDVWERAFEEDNDLLLSGLF